VNRLALLLGVLVVASCGGSTGSTSGAVSGAMCKHPASLDDAGAGACGLGGALVDCESPSGIGCSCLSDTATCDGCGPNEGFTCTNKCHANEYALSCGSIGPPTGPTQDPPVECRTVEATPAGIAFYCCPCL